MVNDHDSEDDDDDDAVKPSMKVYAKCKWANLSRVSTSTLDFSKISKIASNELIKLVDHLSIVEDAVTP